MLESINARLAILRERVVMHDAHARALWDVAMDKAATLRDARAILAQNEREKETMIGWSQVPDGARLARLTAELPIHVEALRRATDDWMAAEAIAKAAAQDEAKALPSALYLIS